MCPESQSSSIPSTKKIFLTAVACSILFLIANSYYVRGDDGTYIALSRSLSQGSYRSINMPDGPSQNQYPPLFPILLLPTAGLGASNLLIIQAWSTLLGLLALWGVISAARLRDPTWGLLAVYPFVLSTLYGEFSTSVLTEVIFVGICYAVVARTQIFVEGSESERGSSLSLDLLIPIGTGCALLLKSAAIALVAAVLIGLLRARKFKAIAVSAVIVTAIAAPWWIWQNLEDSQYVRSHILMKDVYDINSELLSPVEVLTYRIPYNASRYVGRIVIDVLLPPFFRDIEPWTTYFPLKVAASAVLCFLCLGGFVRRLARRKGTVEEIYVVATVGLILLHPVFADRYLFFILPSLTWYFLLAFRNEALRRKVILGWCVLLIAGCIHTIAKPAPKSLQGYIEAIDWVSENSRTDDIILARQPTMVWFYSGRAAKGYPATADINSWPRQRSYIIRDDFNIGIPAAKMFVDPVVTDTERFRHVFTSPSHTAVKIYFQPQDEPGASSD